MFLGGNPAGRRLGGVIDEAWKLLVQLQFHFLTAYILNFDFSYSRVDHSYILHWRRIGLMATSEISGAWR